MAETKRAATQTVTVGDRAVDGFISGILAGMAMAAWLLAVGLATGESPALVLSRFDPGQTASPVTGGLMHLATSGVYGLVFGLLWQHIPRLHKGMPWLVGIAYGLILSVVAQIVLPRSGSPLAAILFPHFVLANVIYGAVLGWLTAKSRQ